VLALASQNRAQGHYGNGKGVVVLFLTEALDRQATLPARAVELTVAKNRHGDTGKVALIFRPDLGTMREEMRP
jgi:replicative DNA helicase